MENYIVITLGLISVIMNIIILSKQSKIMQQLRTPVVKKLSPEMKLKSHKKGFSNDSRQRNRKSGDSDRPNNKRGGNKSNTRNTNRRSNQNNKPRHTTPTEIFSNDSVDSAKSEDKPNINKSAPKVQSDKRTAEKPTNDVKSTNTPAPKTEVRESTNSGRASLAPRGEAAKAENTNSKPENTSPAPKAQESSAPKAEKSIRHGRRTQVKKTPVLDDLD